MSTPAFLASAHFRRICGAEIKKLLSRTTARLGLVAVAGTAILTVLFIMWIDSSGIGFTTTVGDTVTENTLGDKYNFAAADVLVNSLWPRNALFIGRLFLVALTALSVASEFTARTLREDVLRPVPRFAIPAAKFVAIGVWAALSLVVTFVFSAALALPVFGVGGPWFNTLLAYTATFAGDLGLIAVALLAAFATRSVAGTIVALFLFWLLNSAAGWAVWIASKALPWIPAGTPEEALVIETWSDRVATLQLWLPSSALELWQGYSFDTPWAWQSALVLVLITGGSVALTMGLFDRQDVP